MVKPINKIVLALFKIHPMPFLSHVHNMLYNVRTHENNLPGYYFIDLHSTSVHCHVGLFRKYVKVGIHRAGFYLENIHLLNNVLGKNMCFTINRKNVFISDIDNILLHPEFRQDYTKRSGYLPLYTYQQYYL